MKIQHKLFLILFGFSAVLVIDLVIAMQWSINKGMLDYVNNKDLEQLTPAVEQLKKEYQRNNSWQSMRNDHRKFRNLLDHALQNNSSAFDNPPPGRRPPPRHDRPPRTDDNFDTPPPKHSAQPSPPAPPQGRGRFFALLDANKKQVVGKGYQEQQFLHSPITLEDELIGYLAVAKREQLTSGYEFDFLQQQQHFLWLVALLLLLLVMLITIPLAKHLITPLQAISRSMHKLTQGQYHQVKPLKRKDELGELSRHYNELALTLEKNETIRKRWLADISHELRTPVAIIGGELEAMVDGIRPLNQANIASSLEEVKHLQRLLEDFHQLTYADIGGLSYRKENEDLVLLLQDEQAKYQSYLAKENIKLKLTIPADECVVYVDHNRILQLFDNILSNTIKYANASEVNISLTKTKTDNQDQAQTCQLVIEDNGIGVPDASQKKIFEHLYRVEDSRNRKSGGSGLGLSICQQIVQAHQGNIYAQPSQLGGLAIIIELPLA